MAQRAVARLAEKLDNEAKRGGSVEIGEEMRHLTLQVGAWGFMEITLAFLFLIRDGMYGDAGRGEIVC